MGGAVMKVAGRVGSCCTAFGAKILWRLAECLCHLCTHLGDVLAFYRVPAPYCCVCHKTAVGPFWKVVHDALGLVM